jgi:hypothetical protein
MDEDALFALMDEARGFSTADAVEFGTAVGTDGGGSSSSSSAMPPPPAPTVRPTHTDSASSSESPEEKLDESVVLYLPNGLVHVCRGMRCPHLVQSAEVDRAFSCGLSGRLICTSLEGSTDSSWTGRSCGSADPDMNSGIAAGAAWKQKRNAFAASAAAYSHAHNNPIEESVVDFSKPQRAAAVVDKNIKRGAPCIVDVDENALAVQRRSKAIRRVDALRTRETQQRLFSDASSIVLKLFSVLPVGSRRTRKSDHHSHAANKSAAEIAPATSTMDDPRLENYNFVLQMGMRRYVARCKHVGEHVTLSGIHDVSIAANAFVKARKRQSEAKVDTARARSVAVNGRTIELCAQLISSFWAVMCSTPYFIDHQTCDSFRPFAAGVMYALKRGIRLKNDSTVIVPQIELLASQLPELRSLIATGAARQLQQASHKGLCSIHRGLASLDKMEPTSQAEALDKLRVVSEVAARLSTFVTESAKQ